MLEEGTPADREQRQYHSQKRGKARLPNESTEAKNLDDDEWKIYENLTQLNNVTEKHSQQQARKAVNGRREEHSQQQARIKRTERAVPTAGREV